MNQSSGQNCWVVTINSANFDSLGLPWLYHARRYPGIRLCVADAGLDVQQRRKLAEDKVTLFTTESRSHFDMWAGIAGCSDDTILYTTVTDLIDPVAILDKGREKMVFGQWPAESEYYNLCKPIATITSQAKTANYIERRVAGKLGGIAAPTRLCGPSYLWKAMVGMTNLVRAYQPYPTLDAWESLAVNLFAAAYPEYTLLAEGTS